MESIARLVGGSIVQLNYLKLVVNMAYRSRSRLIADRLCIIFTRPDTFAGKESTRNIE